RQAVTPFRMPAMSPTMTEGGITRWAVKEGDAFAAGDILLEVETDKAQIEVEAQDDGIMAKILVPAGEKNIAVNSPIAVLAEEGDDLSNLTLPDMASAKSQETPAQSESSPAPTSPLASAPSATTSANHALPLSPAVGHLVALYEIDPAQIKEVSGPHGRLLKGDVLRYLQAQGKTKPPTKQAPQPKAAPAPSSGSYTDIPLTNMRRIIASRLTESKATIPHSYVKQDLCMDKLMQLRKRLNSTAEVKLSVNDFIIRASALALRDVPDANVRFNPAATDDSTLATRLPTIDISIAVATPAGLITPIIKHADQKGIATISREMKALAERARLNKLKPDEYQGGTFSVSNLGMFGINDFTAVINPPQACILAVGGTRQVASPARAAKALDEALSIDERAVDGVVAAQFLQRLKYYVDEPERMLL
ncbi:2-oxoacid dehydrogenases acyltransferase-domain-containing protein, partial [Dimargaris cristalligena]